jgi:hypothetical protein
MQNTCLQSIKSYQEQACIQLLALRCASGPSAADDTASPAICSCAGQRCLHLAEGAEILQPQRESSLTSRALQVPDRGCRMALQDYPSRNDSVAPFKQITSVFCRAANSPSSACTYRLSGQQFKVPAHGTARQDPWNAWQDPCNAHRLHLQCSWHSHYCPVHVGRQHLDKRCWQLVGC